MFIFQRGMRHILEELVVQPFLYPTLSFWLKSNTIKLAFVS